MKRESCVFYGSWLDAIENLPRDAQGDSLLAILRYALGRDNGTCQPKPIAVAMLTMAKAQIDLNHKRYDAGCKGGRPSKSETEEEPTDNQSITKAKPNNNQNVTKQKPNPNQSVTFNVYDNVYVNDNVNNDNNIIKCNKVVAEHRTREHKVELLEECAELVGLKVQEIEGQCCCSADKSNGHCTKNAVIEIDNKPYCLQHAQILLGNIIDIKTIYTFVEPEWYKPMWLWLDYKRDRGEKYKSSQSVKMFYNKLKTLSNNDLSMAQAIIERSMANNWAGIFELKNYGDKKRKRDDDVLHNGSDFDNPENIVNIL